VRIVQEIPAVVSVVFVRIRLAVPIIAVSVVVTIPVAAAFSASSAAGSSPTASTTTALSPDNDDDDDDDDSPPFPFPLLFLPNSKTRIISACTAASTPHGPPCFCTRPHNWRGGGCCRRGASSSAAAVAKPPPAVDEDEDEDADADAESCRFRRVFSWDGWEEEEEEESDGGVPMMASVPEADDDPVNASSGVGLLRGATASRRRGTAFAPAWSLFPQSKRAASP